MRVVSALARSTGACGQGRPLHQIGSLMVPQFDEIKTWEQMQRNNWQNPKKAQQMLFADGRVCYYYSCQLTRAPANARARFGDDKRQGHVPTLSANWKSGGAFEKLRDATLSENWKQFGGKDHPVWLEESWQALWNWNGHNQNHGISQHRDRWHTYSPGDPIASFSCGCGGSLTLANAGKKQRVSNMLFQEDVVVLIISGMSLRQGLRRAPTQRRKLVPLPIKLCGALEEIIKRYP